MTSVSVFTLQWFSGGLLVPYPRSCMSITYDILAGCIQVCVASLSLNVLVILVEVVIRNPRKTIILHVIGSHNCMCDVKCLLRVISVLSSSVSVTSYPSYTLQC